MIEFNLKRISTVRPKSCGSGWGGWLSQTRPVPRSPDGDKNGSLSILTHLGPQVYLALGIQTLDPKKYHQTQLLSFGRQLLALANECRYELYEIMLEQESKVLLKMRWSILDP